MGTHDDGRTRAWEAAGRHAAALVAEGDRVGLGTGRAAAAGIHALADRVNAGLRCVGVPTSRASQALGRQLGLRLGHMRERVDIAFDGADLVTPAGLVIKGAGGALVRERVVDGSAGRFLVLVDAPKVADSLDAWGVLPIAVVPFAADHVAHELPDLGPRRRAGRSDDGLVIIDLAIPPGEDWRELDARIRRVAGVVDTGLFAVDPYDVLVGAPDGSVRTLIEYASDSRG